MRSWSKGDLVGIEAVLGRVLDVSGCSVRSVHGFFRAAAFFQFRRMNPSTNRPHGTTEAGAANLQPEGEWDVEGGRGEAKAPNGVR